MGGVGAEAREAGAARAAGRPLRLLFAAGGSGGHIYPALAMARAAQEALPVADVLFVGARGGMEERLVPAAGFPLVSLAVRGIVRKRLREALAAGWLLGGAVWAALRLVRRFRPDVVVGTGGYAAGPVGFAALLCGVPLVLQEQNAVPGVTNRLLALRAAVVAVPFPEAVAALPRGTRTLVCGNPVRPELLGIEAAAARRRLGLPPAGRVVLMVAGSKGSAVFARLFAGLLPHPLDATLLFVSGRDHAASAQGALPGGGTAPPGRGRVVVVPYVERMGDALAAADLVVCRSGALTLAEIALVGKPSILIPSPHVTHHHQEANAAAFARAGAALVLPERGLDGAALAKEISALLGDAPRRQAMAAAARRQAQPDALARLVAAVGEVARVRSPGTAPPPALGPRGG